MAVLFRRGRSCLGVVPQEPTLHVHRLAARHTILLFSFVRHAASKGTPALLAAMQVQGGYAQGSAEQSISAAALDPPWRSQTMHSPSGARLKWRLRLYCT